MSPPMRVLVSGASGFIGTRLQDALRSRGHEVIRLVRRRPTSADECRWDPYRNQIDDRALTGLDAVINLSGAGIGDKRWTPQRKRILYDSRIVPTRVLAEHLASLDHRPEVFISQSAIGIYGDRGDEILTEDSAPGPPEDFLAALTLDWEGAAAPASDLGIRVVHPRTGLVLSREAQLMTRLLPLFRAGLGGPLGDGLQWWSWVTLTDVVAAVEHLLGSDLAGPVNLVSPQPVRQRDFAHALARAVRRPALLPAPKFGMRLALGAEKADAIGLSSTRALPERLLDDGYAFSARDLEGALSDIVP